MEQLRCGAELLTGARYEWRGRRTSSRGRERRGDRRVRKIREDSLPRWSLWSSWSSEPPPTQAGRDIDVGGRGTSASGIDADMDVLSFEICSRRKEFREVFCGKDGGWR